MRAGRILARGLTALTLVALAALVGFAAAALRRRPPTSYAASLRQPTQQHEQQDPG